MARVLVTGAGGFAGQHLIRLLLGRGEKITAATLSGAPPTPGTLSEQEISRVRWVALDVTSLDSTRQVIDASAPERVYHLAGQSSVGESFRDPLATWDVNATGTLRLLQALRTRADAGVRVLVVSSAEVYGEVPEGEQPIREDRPLRPVNPYGASKMAAEAATLEAAAEGIGAVVARSFNHVGPGQDERFILPNLARQLTAIRRGERGAVLRVGNLQPRRDFLDVRDVVRAYALLVESGASGEVYNVCSGEPHALEEVVAALVDLSGTGARIVVDEDRLRPVDIPLLTGDPGRLRGLGWQPEHELRTTLADLLQSVEGE